MVWIEVVISESINKCTKIQIRDSIWVDHEVAVDGRIFKKLVQGLNLMWILIRTILSP